MNPSGSLRRRITLVVMTTTATALLLSACSLLIYELRSYRSAWIADLTTQADLIATSSAAALTFDDARAARENLGLLRLRPQIRAGAVYAANGRLFASYRADDADGAEAVNLPPAPGADGYRFDGDSLELFHEIEQNGDRIGTVYLLARHDVSGRLLDYLAILVVVTAASLAIAAVVFGGLQSRLTEPILALAQAAREVVQRRNYRLKVEKTTDDEVGELVDSFNDMLHDLGAEMDQRQKAEDALRAADRRKDEFLATLAHELRNPLAPIVTGLEVLRNTAAGPELQARARDRMTRQLRQMVRLIDDLLDVSRITTNKLELHRQVLDLVVLVREAVEVVDPLLRERRHSLETHWPRGPLWVDGDATRLTQVVVNLLNNAAKYTPAGGRIVVGVGVEDGRAQVRVTDNGLGIDPSQQAEIFEMFMQVDRSLERERAGLGVGLSLARRLVELHGGSIRVASDGLGHGSTFTVTLPFVPAPSASAGAAPAGASAAGAPLRILIADDSVDLATSLGDMLQSLGHVVRIVHDGRAAYEAAVAEVPDVALFDIGMPLLNGYELARRLRLNPCTRDLVMVAITGWGQDADRQRARDAGFDRHLVKPVEPEGLIELLRACRPRAAGGAPLMRA
jgi:signal transduction histidine kinase/ActR/RegA family two-component response regulator